MAESAHDRPETLTHPLSPRWLERPDGYRHFETAYFVGHGKDTFERCAEELLHWEVKIRSGFDIDIGEREAGRAGVGECGDSGGIGGGCVDRAGNSRSAPPRVEAGQEPTIRVRLGPFRLPEPSRVLDVFEATDRCGFTYGTKPGHPVTGEESFILVRTPDDRVFLVLRSVSRAGAGIWRLGEPFVRFAQVIYRRRYGRALLRG
ncbi:MULTISPECIES: DUF1990 family protein [unclassified Brevibacterium]|jgi:uncharacterized protein (UPF0548 family)|uniref:DUF1990 family protein n=1 Tax=unclassified Brevibacterium TaxID=2614124 RepID=UPI001080ADB2|nr:DUF1990 domain-containing protein [Brevibacterium sp. S111]TGD09528.1 DUF1990 domain-containing protein [Brevibacterium sp. S111]